MVSLNFKREEFACKCGCGFDTVDADLLIALENIRGYFDKPVIIHSGCRCKHRNHAVGGKVHSFHLIGRAADFTISTVKPIEVYKYADELFKNVFGIILYENFVHLDTRTGMKYRGH